MYLPRQSEPVQRTLVARPFISRGDGSASELAEVTGQALRASESSVQPSGVNWDLLNTVNTAFRPLLPMF
jgi:hypothetical protein